MGAVLGWDAERPRARSSTTWPGSRPSGSPSGCPTTSPPTPPGSGARRAGRRLTAAGASQRGTSEADRGAEAAADGRLEKGLRPRAQGGTRDGAASLGGHRHGRERASPVASDLMWSLMNTVRHYTWGSRTVIPVLGGDQPCRQAVRGAVDGAHPDAPSVLPGRRSTERSRSSRTPCSRPRSCSGFGTRLPFLMKVLSPRSSRCRCRPTRPTSRPRRPSPPRRPPARPPRDDVTRTFKDPFHKPELLLALTTFEALCGFRPVEESLHCLAKLQVPELKPTTAAWPRGLRSPFLT